MTDSPNLGEITDSEFEITAEMMVHDYDDERTLEDEENMEGGEDPQVELHCLQKERNMPLEELLAMYGYRDHVATENSPISKDVDHQNSTNGASETCEQFPRRDGSESSHTTNNSSTLHLLYEDDKQVMFSLSSDQVSKYSPQPSDDDAEYDSYFEDEGGWRKQVKVGTAFQAFLPEEMSPYDDALPYENEDKLLWNPWPIESAITEAYLLEVEKMVNGDKQLVGNQSNEKCKSKDSEQHIIWDSEQALCLLLQCGYNVEEALRRCRISPYPLTSSMSVWSEVECMGFEDGLEIYGKDFYQIQKNKKTSRHDIFTNRVRFEKRKYILNPTTTDYMQRFIDEQESPAFLHPRERSASPNICSLIYGDPKRHRCNDVLTAPQCKEEEKDALHPHAFDNFHLGLSKSFQLGSNGQHVAVLSSTSEHPSHRPSEAKDLISVNNLPSNVSNESVEASLATS